ncbi:MAG: hypothetical protein HOQ24_09685 [Mycobacteriaceae bacterium]|nr:hypothetical protein [Mycobacteriaceae bacterium]
MKSHSRRGVVRAAITALPLAVVLASADIAVAEPVQPGVTVSPGKPGVRSQPGITTAPPGRTPLPDEVAPATDYAPSRPIPKPRVVAPYRPERMHPQAPTPMPRVAPITPPPGTLRAGYVIVPVPAGLPGVQEANTFYANKEAEWSTYARSIGVPPTRADRIASLETGAYLQAAVSNCLVGGAMGAVAGTIVPLIGTVIGGVLGCVAGYALNEALVPLVPQAIALGKAMGQV